jgi:hypothetical protein
MVQFKKTFHITGKIPIYNFTISSSLFIFLGIVLGFPTFDGFQKCIPNYEFLADPAPIPAPQQINEHHTGAVS